MSKRLLGYLTIERPKRAPLQLQLCRGLRSAIQDGALSPQDQLPSSRDLASRLGLSRNTVTAAYDQLVSEGYLESRPRSGLYVADRLTFQTPVRQPPPRVTMTPRVSGPSPFRPSQPDVRLFPLAAWNRMRARALRQHGEALLHYQSRLPLGLPVLQRALAAYLRDSRGVDCAWEQVAVTSGSQQALYLIGQLLLRPGGVAYVEDPGYNGAKAAFSATGARLAPVPVDAQGLAPPAALEPGSLLYTTPSRQFPTGASLPVARRLALIQAATQASAWIVEDDYDSEFRYSSAPLPSLYSLNPGGRVIYIGSMSKILFPSLRIGYAVLPSKFVEFFEALRTIVDDHGPLVDQATLAEFIASGALYAHLRRCRAAYAERASSFCDTAAALGLPFRFAHTEAGMNLLGETANGDERSERLRQRGFDIPPLSAYSIESRRDGLVFGFTAFEPSAARAALRKLAGCL
ncbi:MAG: PLP-dependent aminotransferase family protein [Bryobacteraceae bacterium]|nr:PLP-dependent aminotransferase family protein [Bryobacteraceae bacterium]